VVATSAQTRRGVVSTQRKDWLGEIDGLDLTLNYLRQKRDQTRRLVRPGPIDIDLLGLPVRAACDLNGQWGIGVGRRAAGWSTMSASGFRVR
jgi:hypothetical protein